MAGVSGPRMTDLGGGPGDRKGDAERKEARNLPCTGRDDQRKPAGYSGGKRLMRHLDRQERVEIEVPGASQRS